MTYGVHLGETYTDWDEGSFKVTDNPTDLAIGGKGFFAVAFTDKSGQTSVSILETVLSRSMLTVIWSQQTETMCSMRQVH